MDSFGSSSTLKRRSPPPRSQRPSAPPSPAPSARSLSESLQGGSTSSTVGGGGGGGGAPPGVPLYPVTGSASATPSTPAGLLPRSTTKTPKAGLYSSPAYPLSHPRSYGPTATPFPAPGYMNGDSGGSILNGGIMSDPAVMKPLNGESSMASGPGGGGGAGPSRSGGGHAHAHGHGEYAYSTTLRRQASIDPVVNFHLPSGRRGSSRSPHRALNGSRGPRRSSGLGWKPYEGMNGDHGYRPPVGDDFAIRDDGVLDRVMRMGRRLWYGRDYEEVAQEEEGVGLIGGEVKETPSAVYAHKTVEQTILDFATDATAGLTTSSLSSLLARYGPNEFELPPSEPLWLKFAKSIYEAPLILLLLASSAVSALLGQYDDAICVVITVVIVLTVGFVQEQRSEKSLEALNKLVPHYCHLIRNGQAQTPLANALFPGDLVTFSVGDRIPADIRLISAVSLEIDESALTGETRPSRKTIEQCERGEGEDTHGEGGGKALGERHCIAFMGTLVRSGHGSGIVVGTGKDTEFGVVFAMMQDVEEKRTPLQLMMDHLAKQLSIFSFCVIGVIFLVGVMQHRDWLEMFTIGVSLAVAAIPEGLPIVTTVTLALGVLRMSKRKAIVKKLPTIEALGSVSVICSDKTGTLTKNEMTVTHIYAVDDLVDLSPHLHPSFGPRHPEHDVFHPSPAMLKSALIGNLCNNAFKNEQGVNVGQATEVALLNVLSVLGAEDQRKNFSRKTEIPFSSETKIMTVSGSLDGASDMVYLKGAVEAVLNKCRYYYVTDGSTPSLDASVSKTILDRANEVSAKGLRVIALAYGFPPKDPNAESNDLVFVGFQGMMDPPRRGVSHAISALHGASVQVVMITGDAEPTAIAIARELGLKITPSSGPQGSFHASSCMLGSQVDQLSERELIERVPSITVFARTTPRHKMAIVKAWQMRGATVAMTGDGVNDSPALKMADIGISMGKSGTDVAKEAADVILVNDDFSSILPAVEEGKSIYYNIQNFLSFQLSTAIAALSLITLSTILGLANPLNPSQLLAINLVMDGPPAQALGVDPVDKEVMRRPPRRKGTSIFSRRLFMRVGFSAIMIVLGTLYVFGHQISDGSMSRRDQTMTFSVFVFLDLVSALQNRGLTCPLFRNRMLFLTVSISFIGQLGLIYISPLQRIFQTEALSLQDLLMLLGIAATSMGAHEARRWWERKVVEREILEQTIGGMA